MQLKKWAAATVCLMMVCVSGAHAQSTFEGRVAAGETRTVTAPFGGTLTQMALRQGQLVAAGAEIAVVETGKVYAPMDGTIRGIELQPGDRADATVCYLAPIRKYTVKATVDKAYDTADNKFVRVGEKVYIACTTDGSHVAEGVITAASGSGYTVETTKGELYMEEKVYIYREADRKKTDRIGSGTVGRTAETAIKGTGSLVRLHVEEGETVERGQLLFETVEGTLDGFLAQGNAIITPVSGTVATIEVRAGQKVTKGDTVLTIYPQGSYVVEFDVPEGALNTVHEAQRVRVYFEQQDEPLVFDGTVLSVDYVARENAAEAVYTAIASIAADDSVRLGMTATVMIAE